MTAINDMEVARDTGFQLIVHRMMFEVAKDKNASTPNADDLNYIHGIANGEVSIFQMAVGTMLTPAVSNAGRGASDAQIKTGINNVWDVYAVAWTNRTV